MRSEQFAIEKREIAIMIDQLRLTKKFEQ